METDASEQRVRVLVVDDTAAVRRLLRTLLIADGHEVVGEASDGWAGVRQAGERHPDVVIMDWSMPTMDGVAATRAIRSRDPDIAVIAYSSADEAGVSQAFLQAGAERCIDKRDVHRLMDAVRELAHERAMRGSGELLRLHVQSWPALARTHVVVCGALLTRAPAQLADTLAEHSRPGATITLDLSDITAMNADGVQALDDCGRVVQARSAALEIHDPSPIARRALRRRLAH